MKLFTGVACRQVVHFENSQCTRCGHALAYLPDRGILTAVEPLPEDTSAFRALDPTAEGSRYRHCGNRIWQRLVEGSPLLDDFRRVFGDERRPTRRRWNVTTGAGRLPIGRPGS